MASPNGQGDTLTIQASEFQRLQVSLTTFSTGKHPHKNREYYVWHSRGELRVYLIEWAFNSSPR